VDAVEGGWSHACKLDDCVHSGCYCCFTCCQRCGTPVKALDQIHAYLQESAWTEQPLFVFDSKGLTSVSTFFSLLKPLHAESI
jgi:hypothetical protein